MTSQTQVHPSTRDHLDWRSLFRLLVILLVVSFLLRIVYAHFLFEDDGLWFTAAEQLLRGKALYREIYFDKPPLLPLVYVGLFRLFGANAHSIVTVRLFTILYVVAVSAVLYVLAFRLYGKREAVISAAAFTLFSTCLQTGHAQGLNTDFMMTLPYTLGALFFIKAVESEDGRRRRASEVAALLAGVFAGLAFQTNPKGVFDLVFFSVLASGAFLIGSGAASRLTLSRASLLLILALIGFAAAALPFLLYIRGTGSFAEYAEYVWKWGTRYARYYPVSSEVKDGIRISIGYFAVNNALTIALCLVIAEALGLRRNRAGTAGAIDSIVSKPSCSPEPAVLLRADVTLLAWFAVSYAGLAIGGRFFSHYFFETLPALCAIAGRGVVLLIDWIRKSLTNPSTRLRGQVIGAVVIIGFGVTLARFHARTASLAIDLIRGRESAQTRNWYYGERNDEERQIAARVSRSVSDPVTPDDLPLRPTEFHGGPNSADSPDYLFVWGYRPEIYFLSGLIPASRFLSTQPLTGVPADVQYENGNHRSILSETDTAAARRQLVRDLSETRPEFIVDEAGMYNSALAIDSFAELRDFMLDYKKAGATGLFMVYRRKDLTEKWRRKHKSRGPDASGSGKGSDGAQ